MTEVVLHGMRRATDRVQLLPRGGGVADLSIFEIDAAFFAAPASLDSLAALNARFPDATLVGGAGSDTLAVIVNKYPVVNAGPDQTICAGVAAVMDGQFGGSASAATWSGET